MANVANNDVVEVTVRGTCQGQPVFNVFSFFQTGAPASDYTPGDLALVLKEAWQAEVLPFLSAQYTLNAVLAQISWISTGGMGEPANPAEGLIYYSTSGATGAISGDCLPSNVAGVFTFACEWTAAGTIYSSRHPTRLSGIPESAQIDGSLTADIPSDMLDALSEFLESATGFDPLLIPVFRSRQPYTPPGPPTYRFHPIAAQFFRRNLRTMRRRGKGTSTGGYSS